jgi:DNA-binding XRE family transcriptional regulator
MEDNSIREAIDIVCRNLPSLRGILNMTQQDLATKIGTSRQGIINFEHQEKKITKSMLIALISYFSLRARTAAFLKTLGAYNNSYIISLGFDENLCNYIIENGKLED